jgi:hypothetical protein
MFIIQNPLTDKSETLHEVLLKKIKSSSAGGGAYAFISVSGVQLLLNDTFFKDYLREYEYTLIVGIDSVTSEKAIKELISIKEEYNNLTLMAYLNPTPRRLFHPKFSWFENIDQSGGTLTLGSGNLTVGGLRQNTEAIVSIELDNEELYEIKEKWFEWLNAIEENLKPINSTEVMYKVKENDRRFKINKLTSRSTVSEIDYTTSEPLFEVENNTNSDVYEQDDNQIWQASGFGINEVLIAEVPKSGTRWNQVNFSKDVFENYFGAQAGVNNGYRILLKNVDENGELSEHIESRQAVSVASRNWRFELEAAKNAGAYPIDGEPIVVFARTGIRMYKYFLSMPDGLFHEALVQFLDSNYEGNNSRVKRRMVTNCQTLIESIPSFPM